jgi:hypothetical protein
MLIKVKGVSIVIKRYNITSMVVLGRATGFPINSRIIKTLNYVCPG